MIIVCKFGTFWIVYCPGCAWRSDAEGAWQDAERLRAGHVCEPAMTLRIEIVERESLALIRV